MEVSSFWKTFKGIVLVKNEINIDIQSTSLLLKLVDFLRA